MILSGAGQPGELTDSSDQSAVPSVIVGIGGSLRTGSTSLAALRVALDAAAAAGARCELFDLNVVRLPMYDAELPRTAIAADAERLLDAVRRADGFLWSSPGYHGTVSGAFKNALDYFQYLSDDVPTYISGKPVGMIATAGGTLAAVQAVTAMIHCANALRGWPVPLAVPIGEVDSVIDAQGNVTSAKFATRLRLLSSEVLRFAATMRGQAAVVYPHS